jgi:hypothetical protein
MVCVVTQTDSIPVRMFDILQSYVYYKLLLLLLLLLFSEDFAFVKYVKH